MMGDGYGLDWVDARCHRCPARFDSVASLDEHLEDEHATDAADEEPEWKRAQRIRRADDAARSAAHAEGRRWEE